MSAILLHLLRGNPPRTNISLPHSSHIIPSMQPHFLFAISTTTKANVSTSTVRKHKQAHINAGDSTHSQLHEITCVSFSTMNTTVTSPNRATPPLDVNFILAPRISCKPFVLCRSADHTRSLGKASVNLRIANCNSFYQHYRSQPLCLQF